MSRCQHCKKLTHSEDLYVTYKKEDFEKVMELRHLENWTAKFMYSPHEKSSCPAGEYGKLKCGDIYIHFIALTEY